MESSFPQIHIISNRMSVFMKTIFLLLYKRLLSAWFLCQIFILKKKNLSVILFSSWKSVATPMSTLRAVAKNIWNLLPSDSFSPKRGQGPYTTSPCSVLENDPRGTHVKLKQLYCPIKVTENPSIFQGIWRCEDTKF